MIYLMVLMSVALTVCCILSFSGIAARKSLLVRTGVPMVGGLAVAVPFFACSLTWFSALPSGKVFAILASSFIMLVFGVIDDLRELSVAAKFLTQIISAGVLILAGVRTELVYIGDALNLLLTVFWIIGITNAFNHLDVMDGVAAICALASAGGLSAIAFMNNDPAVGILNLFLCAGLAVFLGFNLPPARVYLGNAGAHFIGFVIAASALKISYAPSRISFAVFAPLLILCFPILDTLFLICMRVKKRKSIFRKSDDHIVLRLAVWGFPKTRIVEFVLIASLVFAALGIAAIRVAEPVMAGMLLAVFCSSALFLLKISTVKTDG